MQIENTTWSICTLLDYYKLISKPKFQRKSNWINLPDDDNSNKPNNKEYMEFLIKNKNSINPISLGYNIKEDKECYIIIDGNNRLNCIIKFYNKPYKLFKEYYEKIINLIDNNDEILTNDKLELKKSIFNLNYDEIASFRRFKDTINTINTIDTIDIKISNEFIRILEDELIEISKKFLLKNKARIDQDVKININIFKNVDMNKYSEIFEDINKHSNSLSQNELLSGILYNEYFKLNDINIYLFDDLINEIKLHYNFKENKKIKKKLFGNKNVITNKNNDFDDDDKEVLEDYKFIIDKNNKDILNVYDFMLGFQNYCNKKYKIIKTFRDSGLSIFFKIYEYVYGDIYPGNTIVINHFIFEINYACNILSKSYSYIESKNIDLTIFNQNENFDLFNNESICMFLLIIIIKYKFYNNDLHKYENIDDFLIKKIKICIIYHILCVKNYIKNNECSNDIKNNYLKYDIITKYTKSNVKKNCSYVMTGKINDILDLQSKIFFDLLNLYLKNKINEKKYRRINKNNKTKRKLCFIDKIIIINYYVKNILNNDESLIDKKYTINSIIPCNINYENELDIARIGNLIPIPEEYYEEQIKNKSLYPIYYNNIIKFYPENINDIIHNGKISSKLLCNNKYNELCINNERIYINSFIDDFN